MALDASDIPTTTAAQPRIHEDATGRSVVRLRDGGGHVDLVRHLRRPRRSIDLRVAVELAARSLPFSELFLVGARNRAASLRRPTLTRYTDYRHHRHAKQWTGERRSR